MSISIITSAFDLLFQPNCLVCKSYSKNPVCHRCQLPPIKIKLIDPDNFDQRVSKYDSIRNFYSFWNYTSNSRDLCLAIKYDPSPKLIKLLAQKLAPYFLQLYQEKLWDKIIAVPASEAGYSKRGFNHAALFASELLLRAGLNKSIFFEPLLNVAHRIPQSKLSQTKRIQAISKRYMLKRNVDIKNMNILLIDDILTTGSTLTAAAMVLKQAGVINVDALTICYSEYGTGR